MKTLVIGQIHPEALALLKNRVSVISMSQAEFDVVDTMDCEVVVFRTFNPMHKTQLDKMPRLKYAILCSVGMDNLDAFEMKRRGIELIVVPGTNANSVAEHVLYLLFALLRQDPKRPFAELRGKTVGICGFGAVGKLVARKLKEFECRVVAYDVVVQDPAVVLELGVTMVSFEEIFSQCDIVSLHVPFMKETQGLVGEKAFSLMKSGSFLINTSRAEIVDEHALLSSLHRFRGVGLDVYSEVLAVGLKNGSAVLSHVILTPHVAAQGEDSFRAQCVRPVEEFLKKI